MHSLPYPITRTRTSVALLVIAHLFGALLAPYILAFPPVSYEGFGLMASAGWGVAFGAGCIAMLVGKLRRSYLIEVPGVVLSGTGLLIYALLSWEQVWSGSPGSGTRALLVCMFFSLLLHRAEELRGHHRTLKRIDRIGRG